MIVLLNSPKCLAADLDEIENYEVIVEPRMTDGTLDITYKITWKVLDSTTEGPLKWVQIGTPNSKFDNVEALSDNIISISKYGESYVKIIFDKEYYAGEQITFKYKIHQSYMYKISSNKCKYSFIPAWFTDIKINKMTVKWNLDGVKFSNAKLIEDNYLVWQKTNMAKGKKMKINVRYDKDAFTYLNEQKQNRNDIDILSVVKLNFSTVVITIILVIISCFLGGGYYRS